MSSQQFNSSGGGLGFCLDLNVLPSALVPSVQGPLVDAFGVMGLAGETDPEWSDMPFQSLSFSLHHPLECMVNRRSNDEGDGGYAGPENKSMSSIYRGEEVDANKSTSAAGKTEHAKVCYRGHWKPAEDNKLKELVAQFGPQNWNMIAQHIEGRSGKSCRLRWFNQLDPKINKRVFTEEEEQMLLAAHSLYGNKWAIISKLFPGRTDNAVKNHWHVMIARMQREQSSGYKWRMHPTLNQSLPDGSAFTISNNTASGSTITSNMDESASTYANLSSTPTSTRPIPMSFDNPIPAQNHHAHGSITGLSGEKRETTVDFGSDKFLGAGSGLYKHGPMGKLVGVTDKSIYSNWNSEVSVAESFTINMANLSIPRETEDVGSKANMSFIDFLGVGDA